MTSTPTNGDFAAIPFAGDGGAISAVDEHPQTVMALLGDGEIVIGVYRPSLWYVLLWPLGSLLFIAGLVFALAWLTRFSWANWSEMQAFGLGLVFAGNTAWLAVPGLGQSALRSDRPSGDTASGYLPG